MRSKTIFFITLFSITLFFPVVAHAAEMSSSSVNISADVSIEWQQETNKLIATGNAEAHKGNLSLNSDTISAVYIENKNGNREITDVEANGNIKINSPENKMIGNHAKYDVINQSIFLSGSPAVITQKNTKETIRAYKGIEYKQKEGLIKAKGNVKVVKNKHTISSDELKAYLSKNDKNQTIKSIEAIGNVNILSGKEKINCAKAIYNPKTEIAELFGPITIAQGKNILKGSYATFNLKTGISQILSKKPSKTNNDSTNSKGRVQGVFMPAN